MKKAKSRVEDIRAEYRRSDLGVGERGKFYAEYQKGHNLALLRPDVAAAFPTDEAVNEALSSLIRIAQTAQLSAGRRRGGSASRVARPAARRSS